MAEEDDVVILDSCASRGLFIVGDQSYLEPFEYTPGGAIQTTNAGISTPCLGGSDAVKKICSTGLLKALGYGEILLRVPKIVTLEDDEKKVLTAKYAETGMPYISIYDVLR